MTQEKVSPVPPEIKIAERDLPWIGEWSKIFQETGTYGYIKGGYIRDVISNIINGTDLVPKDVDLMVAGRINKVVGVVLGNGGQMVERRSRKKTPVFRVALPSFPGVDFELGVALIKPELYENATPEQIRLYEATNTDFDVNSMSIGLSDLDLLDPHGGIQAIKNRQISLLDTQSLYRNPENILRGFKVKDKLGANFSYITSQIISEHSKVLRKVKRPFLDSQLRPLLTSVNATEIWQELTDLGITQNLTDGDVATLEQAKQIFLRNE